MLEPKLDRISEQTPQLVGVQSIPQLRSLAEPTAAVVLDRPVKPSVFRLLLFKPGKRVGAKPSKPVGRRAPAPVGKVKAQGVAGSSPDDELWTPREQPSKRSSLARATNSGANLL